MALENCLQLNTATRVCGVKCQSNSFSQRRENVHLQIHQKVLTLKKNNLLGYSNVTISRKSQFVCQAREALNQVKVVTDSSWEEQVIGSNNPVLVEFWAPWCGPCRMIAPVIDELAKEYSGKVDCYKVNTDDCPNIASQYGIRSIPTVLFFKNGEKKESIIGAVPKSTLSATIDKYIDV